MRPLRVALLAMLVLPGAAQAGIATLAARDVPLHGGRTLQRVSPRFDLAGLHWQGSGTVLFQTRSVAGRWSAWHRAAPEGEDLPNEDSPEARRTRGWRLGNPYWTGTSDAIRYRLKGQVTRLRAYFVTSPTVAVPPRKVSIAGSPPIVTRFAWHADESIRRAPPAYADAVRLAIVHHTAGSNSYTRAQSAAIVRAIEIYHVKGNGWNDIGYNFLVDKYGQVFEGRYGGVDRNVVGAHAQGFNTGTAGVAVMGNYNSVDISAAAQASLESLLAWRLDLAHVDPLSTLTYTSGGNARFPPGTPVFLRAISGHRDTGFTDCPGTKLYADIPTIASDTQWMGLPKLYAPDVRGAVGGKIRFRAQLSDPLPWTVTVTDGLGNVVATGTGEGTGVDWTWDATAVTPGSYAYTIAAPDVRPATGLIGGSLPPLTLTLSASTMTITPNGDGRSDQTVVRFKLGAPAQVTAAVLDPGGATLVPLFTDSRPAGKYAFVWRGSNLPDGRYKLAVSAQAPDGRQARSALTMLVDRTLASFKVGPRQFSPNGDGRSDTLALSFALGAPAQVKLRLLRGSTAVGTLVDAPLQPGPQRLSWNGRIDGHRLADGEYQAVVSATDTLATVSQGAFLTLDTTPPRLKILSVSHLDFWVSERSIVTLLVDGKRIRKIEPAGRFHVPHPGPAAHVSASAMDFAGNAGEPVVADA